MKLSKLHEILGQLITSGYGECIVEAALDDTQIADMRDESKEINDVVVLSSSSSVVLTFES